jgi:hypothetical protein
LRARWRASPDLASTNAVQAPICCSSVGFPCPLHRARLWSLSASAGTDIAAASTSAQPRRRIRELAVRSAAMTAIVTFDQFVEYGVACRFVRAAVDDGLSRGLITVPQRGKRSSGPRKFPTRYGLGWFPSHDGAAASNRWKAWMAPGRPYRAEYIKQYTNVHWEPAKAPLEKQGGISPLVYKGSLGNCQKVNRGKSFRVPPRPSPPASFPRSPRTSLPPGWKIDKADDGRVRIISDGGSGLPVADHPLVGDTRQQAALLYYVDWKKEKAANDREERERRMVRDRPARLDDSEVHKQRSRVEGARQTNRRGNDAATTASS